MKHNILNQLSIKEKRRYIWALNHLLKCYKKEVSHECPLCKIADDVKRRLNISLPNYCYYCVWNIFEDIDPNQTHPCSMLINEKTNLSFYDQEIIDMRIEEIPRWIKEIKNSMEKR